jgi:hypothetical protein
MRRCLTFLAVVTTGLCATVAASADEVEIVVAKSQTLLADYENNDREFYKLQIGNVVSYFHQRMIGEAIVERDFLRYQFDVDTGELLEQTIRWRDDLPRTIDPAVSQADAEALCPGDVQFSSLYFISPDSYVLPFDPAPTDPCWVVRTFVGDTPTICVIDAMTGDLLGYGVPPPAEGYSLTGPQHVPECSDPWWFWYTNARDWFETMGYDPTDTAEFPTTSAVQNYVADHNVAVFYELAHGGSTYFTNGCPDQTTAGDVEAWLDDYASLPFAFVGSCEGMCFTGDGTFAHEFRKGLDIGSAVVGYCGMDTQPCETCWGQSVDWQNTLFTRLSQGATVEEAFDAANLDFPACANSNCMRLAGDPDMQLVPEVDRSVCGTFAAPWDITLGYRRRPYYVACDSLVLELVTITVDPGVTMAFLNNSQLRAVGVLEVTDSSAPVRFVREMDDGAGMMLTGGQLRISGGGAIRIYE